MIRQPNNAWQPTPGDRSVVFHRFGPARLHSSLGSTTWHPVMKWFFGIGSALILVGFLVWRFIYGEVFSATLRARLKPGITTNEVRAIIGPPSSVSRGHWVYTRPLMYNVGLVFFDDSGHLTSAIND
jgi:hypothetical protein